MEGASYSYRDARGPEGSRRITFSCFWFGANYTANHPLAVFGTSVIVHAQRHTFYVSDRVRGTIRQRRVGLRPRT